MLRLVDTHATGMANIDAQDDFRRARRAQTAGRIWRHLSPWKHSRSGPRALCSADPLATGPCRLEVVHVGRIIGTVDRSVQFDARFRPASERLRGRWERIARAHRQGVPLPPIVLLQRPDGYYVVDGRHRVSVALALGQTYLDAWVIGSYPTLLDPARLDTALAAGQRPGPRDTALAG